jgi:hypothetical protein
MRLGNWSLLLSVVLLATVHSQAKESQEFATKVINEHELSGQGAVQLRQILTQAPGITRNIGTEDANELHGPNNSWHMASRAQCIEKVLKTGAIKRNPEFERICGAKWMSPVPDYSGQTLHEVHTCIDQFEFPDIPCEYPVVWTPSSLAKNICESMGKRVCNSHEWEGACGGAMDPNNPYRFDLPSLEARRRAYNQSRQIIWAFDWNPQMSNLKDSREVCGVYNPADPDISSPMREQPSKYYTPIGKSPACQQGPQSDYQTCGTNSWPAGFKYQCRSRFDVYDMHGNLAEVVNFPTSPEGLAHGHVTDKTERKGSFFVYRSGYPDDCRARQPYEHFQDYATGTMAYYQEGFRCCKDVK